MRSGRLVERPSDVVCRPVVDDVAERSPNSHKVGLKARQPHYNLGLGFLAFAVDNGDPLAARIAQLVARVGIVGADGHRWHAFGRVHARAPLWVDILPPLQLGFETGFLRGCLCA